MDDDPPNNGETERVAGAEPDPHGQAALLLVESLIHCLTAKSIISVEEAVEIAQVATDVKREMVHENEHRSETANRTLALLDAICASLRIDLL